MYVYRTCVFISKYTRCAHVCVFTVWMCTCIYTMHRTCVSTVVHTCIYTITYIMYSMLLWYVVLYRAFVCITIYLGETDFSIISALKSHVTSPRIAFKHLMHSKTGLHFLFFTSTCMPHLQSSNSCMYFLCRSMY